MPHMRDLDINSVLEAATDDELDPLVDYILSASISEGLSKTPGFIKYRPVHSRYTAEIAHEIRLYGGNTLVNFFRKEGPSYAEVVRDVAARLNVPSTLIKQYSDSVPELERCIFISMASKMSKKMTPEERMEFYKLLSEGHVPETDELIKALETCTWHNLSDKVIAALAIVVAAAVARTMGVTAVSSIVGGGFAFGASRLFNVLGGPIIWLITGAIAAIDIAGPGYRVTIPSVMHIACLRIKQEMERRGEDCFALTFEKFALAAPKKHLSHQNSV